VKKLLLFLLILGGALAGLAYWISHPRTVRFNESTFTYAPVEHGNLVESVSATGTVQPRDVILVSSEASGTVLEVYAEINDIVEEGATLLKLDDRLASLKLEQARAKVKSAEADVARAQTLEDAAKKTWDLQQELKGKGISRPELEAAEEQWQAARAAVKAAQAKVQEAQTGQKLAQLGLDLTRVKVPVTREVLPALADGALTPIGLLPAGEQSNGKRKYLIIDSKVKRGQLIGPPVSANLFTLASDLGQIEVHTQVNEADIGSVRKGQEASFTVTAYSEEDRRFHGKVKEIRPMPTNVQGAVYYNTVIEVKNQKDPTTNEWQLRPGMTASVDIVRREHKNVWKVPTAALNLQLDPLYQSDAARAHLAEWSQRKDHEDWKPIWTWDRERGRLWPIFVRIGGRNKAGETGIKDNQFNEVLEWEPGREPAAGSAGPQVITNAPPARKPGLFDQPTNIKL
jgi:HlyD family secretion protein